MQAGDLVRMPRGIPHGYFNKSDKPARALFWVSPMQKLEALFNQLHEARTFDIGHMPKPDLSIDTSLCAPEESARRISEALRL